MFAVSRAANLTNSGSDEPRQFSHRGHRCARIRMVAAGAALKTTMSKTPITRQELSAKGLAAIREHPKC